MGYRWWPESTLITWGPTVNYLRLYDHAGVLQDEQIQGQASFQFRHNISVTANMSRDLERFEEVDFRKSGYGAFGVISSRLVSIVGGINRGDGILYSYDGFTNPLTAGPYQRAILGESTTGNFLISGRPSSRWRSDLTGIFSRLADPTAARPTWSTSRSSGHAPPTSSPTGCCCGTSWSTTRSARPSATTC